MILKPFCLLAALFFCGIEGAFTQTSNQISVDDLRQLRLPDVILESVTMVTPSGPNQLAHAKVDGVIGGNIHFELLLPQSWNGRFVMGGGGGFVGTVQNIMNGSVNLGCATVGTDTGHQWPEGHMAGWALDNVEAQLDFGYLAVHRTAEVAKALVRAYYRAEPQYSYFLGCSRGGGQAMMEAQHYPQDFDGIVAGAPAFNWTGFSAMMVSIAKALYPNPAQLEKPVLTKEALQKLQQGILAQGDAVDGLKDGIIADPPSLHFDLAKVEGLSTAQRQAVEAIYAGARNEKGLIAPGYPRGAECDPDQWIAWLVGPVPGLIKNNHVPDLTFAFSTQVFKYFVFNNPDWDYSTYDFSNFEKDTRLAGSFLNATNANLDALKARKGKLILWHGWADPALPAQATVDYYRLVQAYDPSAADYCRLFMIPGCLHCGGGPGASEVDWLGIITDWVEHGKAPNRLVADKHGPGQPVMHRPLYPYPQTVIYKGTGDPNNADSFAVKGSN